MNNMKNTEKRLKKIDELIDKLHDLIKEKNKIWDYNKSYEEYQEYLYYEYSLIGKLDREKRMLMPFELSELPKYGDVMSLSDFIDNVESGGFIDYDGSGCYVKDGKKTNITIVPSDVKNNSIRKDFDTIIWFNR